MTRDEAKAALASKFHELNDRHFAGKLTLPIIQFFDHYHDPVTKKPKNAMYALAPGLSMMIFTDEVLAEGMDVAFDSLLHEMVHHAVATLYKGDHQEHGSQFVDVANRIAGELGLGSVAPDSTDATCWPQTLRPPKT